MSDNLQVELANSKLENVKDWAMARTMSELVKTKPQKNLTPVIINSATRNTKLVLALLPEWGVFFPPYNMSKLSSIARSAGFHTTVFDINVKAWNKLKDILSFDPWDQSKEWMWIGQRYHSDIHQHVKPILEEYLERMIETAPDVVGFSMYYTNEQPTNWLAEQIRQRLPNAKIIVGGPQAPSMARSSMEFYDHIVEGEGEQVLLNILENIENKQLITEKILRKNPKLRLDLDSMPFPDYSDYDMSDYSHPGGITSEISRGCVAKCVFCTEVHFWKYRGRMSGSLLDEVEYQYKHYGANFVWFIDSLVNGNLKELRGFCLGLLERKLKINWQGYARCDGRMDLAFYEDLRASGCIQLSYGIESGSQKVLDDMKKEITLDEIESNLSNGKQVGINAHTNWIIGFPSEDNKAFADTLTLVWRIRNYNILTISPGISLMLSPGSEMSTNTADYNISPALFLNMWATNDLSNTKVHRLIRQKIFNIFLEQLNSKNYIYGFERPNLKQTYSISYDQNMISESIDREESFDYNIIQSDLGIFANTVMNEIWPLLRILYKALGAYTISVAFDPEKDLLEFGDRLGCQYTAKHEFTIDKVGCWEADHYYSFRYDRSPNLWQDVDFDHVWKGSGQW